MYDNCSGLCLKTCLELSYFKNQLQRQMLLMNNESIAYIQNLNTVINKKLFIPKQFYIKTLQLCLLRCSNLH